MVPVACKLPVVKSSKDNICNETFKHKFVAPSNNKPIQLLWATLHYNNIPTPHKRSFGDDILVQVQGSNNTPKQDHAYLVDLLNNWVSRVKGIWEVQCRDRSPANEPTERVESQAEMLQLPKVQGQVQTHSADNGCPNVVLISHKETPYIFQNIPQGKEGTSLLVTSENVVHS